MVTSRLLWGIGYHQPPVYYLAEWQAAQGDLAEPAAAGALPRAHARLPRPRGGRHLVVLRESIRRHASAEWPADRARDARQLRSEGRRRTRSTRSRNRPKVRARWFVARDLGQTFGRTGALDPPRGDPTSSTRPASSPASRTASSASTTAAATRRSSTRSRRPTSAGCASGWPRSPTSSCRTPFAPAATRARPPTVSSRRLEQKIAEGAQLKD